MKTLEHWFLQIADSDVTWFGLNWLRPDKHRHISSNYILLSSFLLGLPGMGVGLGLIFLFIGRVEPMLWVSMFILVMMFELPLNFLLAHFWNQRARQLAREVPTA